MRGCGPQVRGEQSLEGLRGGIMCASSAARYRRRPSLRPRFSLEGESLLRAGTLVAAILLLSAGVAVAQTSEPRNVPWDMTVLTPNVPLFVNHKFVSITELLKDERPYDGKIIESWGLLGFHDLDRPFISRPNDDSLRHQFETGICLQATSPLNESILTRLTGLTIGVSGYSQHVSDAVPKECRSGMIRVLAVDLSIED